METKGINLKIDTDINYLCESSRNTSNITRNLIYILALILFLTLINFINTYGDWSILRINSIESRINSLQKERQNDNSINFELEKLKKQRDQIIEYRAEHLFNIHIPVLETSFDINYLTLMSGSAITIILLIIKYSFNRELKNLKIILNAISNRYTDDADKIEFSEILSKSLIKDKIDKRIAQINMDRRKYHYEVLIINDFLLSNTSINKFNSKQKGLFNIFWLPLFIYIILVVNDMLTLSYSFGMSYTITCFTIFYSILLMFFIVKLCKDCVQIRNEIYNLFLISREKNYSYNDC